MVSSTLCPAVHILGSQNVYSRAEGIVIVIVLIIVLAVFVVFIVTVVVVFCLKKRVSDQATIHPSDHLSGRKTAQGQ